MVGYQSIAKMTLQLKIKAITISNLRYTTIQMWVKYLVEILHL